MRQQFTIRNRRGRARWPGGGKCRSDFPTVEEELGAMVALLRSGMSAEAVRALISASDTVRAAVARVEQDEGFLAALPLTKAIPYRDEVLSAFDAAMERLEHGEPIRTETESDGERRTKVPKTCLLCLSPRRKEIEGALASGESYRS